MTSTCNGDKSEGVHAPLFQLALTLLLVWSGQHLSASSNWLEPYVLDRSTRRRRCGNNHTMQAAVEKAYAYAARTSLPPPPDGS